MLLWGEPATFSIWQNAKYRKLSVKTGLVYHLNYKGNYRYFDIFTINYLRPIYFLIKMPY